MSKKLLMNMANMIKENEQKTRKEDKSNEIDEKVEVKEWQYLDVDDKCRMKKVLKISFHKATGFRFDDTIDNTENSMHNVEFA